MPFVKRNSEGDIIGMALDRSEELQEEVAPGSPELESFYRRSEFSTSEMKGSDLDFVRVTEDLIDLLIAKGIILFTDLPLEAQQKILFRRKLRAGDADSLDLLGND